MAKQKPDFNLKDIEAIVKKYDSISKMNAATSDEFVKISRELKKAVAILESGFIKSREDAESFIENVQKGLKVTDEYTTKLAKNSDITNRELDAVIKQFRIIEKLDAKKLKVTTDVNNLVKEQNEELFDQLSLSGRLLSKQEEILNIVSRVKKQAEMLSSEFENTDEILKKFIENEIDLSSMLNDPISKLNAFDDLTEKVTDDLKSMVSYIKNESIYLDLRFDPMDAELAKQIDNVRTNIAREKKLRFDALHEYFAENTLLSDRMAAKMAADMSGGKIKFDIDTGAITNKKGTFMPEDIEYAKQKKVLDGIVKKQNLSKQVTDIQNEFIDLLRLEGNLTKQQQDRLKQIQNSMTVADRVLINQVHARIDIMRKAEAELVLANKVTIALRANTKILHGMGVIVNRIGDGFDYINDILPLGIGNFLGLQQASYELTRSHERGVESFVEKYKETQNTAQAFAAYSAEIRSSLAGLMNPVTAIVAGLAVMYKFSSDITEKYKEMTNALHTSIVQNKEILKVQYDTLTSVKNQFATMNEIQEVQAAIVGSSGKVFELTKKDAKELTIQMTNISKAFGVTNEEAVKVHKTFKMVGADDKMALMLQKNMHYMSEMAGLSPQIVAQDLLESADVVATYFAGMPEEAAKAAVEVRRMGMSLKQAGSIAQKMLNLEGFMTDMYELYAMTGTNLDFSQAFEKGLQGDIKGMTKSIVDEIGSLQEFNDMDYLTRQKIATTLGMSSDELANMVKMNEDMAKYSEDQQTWLQDNYKTMGDLTKLSDEQIKQRINDGMATDRLGVAWEKIKGTLTMALLPLVESFAAGIDAIAPLIDAIVVSFKAVGSLVKIIAPIIKGLFLPFQFIGGKISELIGWLEDMFTVSDNTKKLLDDVSAKWDMIGQGIGVALAGFIAFYKPAREGFKSLFSSIFESIPIIGKMFKGSSTDVKSSATDTGAAVSSMTDGIKSSMSEMIDSVKTMMQSMTESVKKSFSEMKGESASLGNAAKQVTSKVTADVADATVSAGDKTIETNKKIEKSVDEVKKKISKDSGNSLISKASETKTGKVIREIGIKALATWGIRSTMEMLNFTKLAEEHLGFLGENTKMVVMAASGGLGTLVGNYLNESMEKVLTKTMEKTIDSAIDKPLGKTFKGAVDKGKGAFGTIGDLVKKAFNIPQVSTTGTFDQMATSAKKAVEPLSTVKEITEDIKTKKNTELETITTAQEVVNNRKVVEEPLSKKVKPSLPDTESVDKPVRSIGDKLKSGFDFVKNILSSAWDGIKTVVTDVIKLITDSLNTISKSMSTVLKNISDGIAGVMKNLSSGIGESINNILSGIGKGLSSFKVQALIGAAALGIVAGALWVVSEAVQNFISVSWEDMAKAGVALVGLGAAAVAAAALSPILLTGSIAIAAMGASLIPFAYAASLASENIDKIVPLIEAFGSVITSAFTGLSMVIRTASDGITNIFSTFAGIDIPHLLAIGPALASISVGLAALGAGSAIGAIGSAISSVFGGDPIKDLERFAALADPLTIVNNVLKELGSTLSIFSQSLESLNTESLSKFASLGMVSAMSNVQPVRNPVQPPTATAQVPSKESVGQNKQIRPSGVYDVTETGTKLTAGNTYNNQDYQNQNYYGDDTDMMSDNTETNMLLKQMIQLMDRLVKKDTNVILDGQRLNTITKKYNNN